MKTPHNWVPSPYGHGEWACTYCPDAQAHIEQGGKPHPQKEPTT